MKPDLKYSYFQGKIVPAEEAMVSIQTHALQYGTSVFGGIRGYYNKSKDNIFVFRLKDHFRRLLNSVRIMQLQYENTPEILAEAAIELIRKNELKENVYLRPFVYTSALQLSPRFHDVRADLAIYALRLNDYLDTQNGLKAMVSSWRRIDDNMIPTLSKAAGGYVNSALAKSEAVQNGFDEAVFLDSRGYVSEGSAENIFIVSDGKLITPSLSSAILGGITRRTLIELCQTLKLEVIERQVTRSELYTADELFFCGTGVQVAWIKEVDRRVIGNGEIGPITKKIQTEYFRIVTGENSDFSKWLSPVY
ncbi:MAG TPA: branched-chain amino acid transaminase [Leptospiraceae bacterium]|nr:branched-chain amino acid transaminase [Leptospiraceae bacterium]HMY65220.1 branched-chain amino acid transaminase [Leptospiraceae bacterium]HNF15525.1 branched-chain amino acid transaminase [Leptospiraceae bacterium]HNF24931.1 branched-chain amino acid transaminase [Leptospiraceae bacterium]HNH07264.1 branched-chain amino acid transaminase [Leptospiraceae bacterium]